MDVKVKINWDRDDLWCHESKEPIEIGEEYCVVIEELWDGEKITKIYKKENLPLDEDAYYEEE